MKTNYDLIASEYKRAKQQPWRMHIEHFTLFGLVGDLKGKTVLDLACGEGFHTRYLKSNGAARVVGVDISEKMIELARNEEKANPLGIEYVVCDAKELALEETFDLVFAAFLLNYASTREELLAMCRSISRSLKPGCRFISVNNHPEQPLQYYPEGKKYGFDKTLVGEPREGASVTYTIFLEGGSIDITNYNLAIATHEWAFREAGLREVRWHSPRLSPEGEAEFGREFWSSFLEHSPIIFIECVK